MTIAFERRRLLRSARAASKLVEGWIEGPCAQAADLRGINTLMLDFLRRPGLRPRAVRVRARDGTAIRQGPDRGRRRSDRRRATRPPRSSARSSTTSSSGPTRSGWSTALHAMGARGATAHLRQYAPAPVGDGQAGLRHRRPRLPRPAGRGAAGDGATDQVLLGNIDPVRVLRDGTPESITAAIAECHAASRRPLHRRRRLRGAARNAAGESARPHQVCPVGRSLNGGAAGCHRFRNRSSICSPR